MRRTFPNTSCFLRFAQKDDAYETPLTLCEADAATLFVQVEGRRYWRCVQCMATFLDPALYNNQAFRSTSSSRPALWYDFVLKSYDLLVITSLVDATAQAQNAMLHKQFLMNDTGPCGPERVGVICADQ